MLRKLILIVLFSGLWVLGGVFALFSGRFFMGATEIPLLTLTALYPNVPNESKDEYIIITNTSCNTVSLSGVSLMDLTNKPYIFQSGTIDPGQSIQIMQPDFRFALNNDKETVTLKGPTGEIWSTRSYTKTTKGVVITYSWTVPECTISTNTGETLTGSVPIGSGSESISSGTSVSGGVVDGSGSMEILSGALGSGVTIGVDTGSGSSMIPGETQTGVSLSLSGSLGSSSGSESLPEASGGASTGVVSSGTGIDNVGTLLAPAPDMTITTTASGVISHSSGTQIVSGDVVSDPGNVPTPQENTGAANPTGTSTTSGGGGGDISSSGQLSTSVISIPSSDPLLPVSLAINDSDGDGRYDEVRLGYIHMLTGTIEISSLKVFSATGGIFLDQKYEGYDIIQSATVSGSEILFHLDRSATHSGVDSWGINKTTTSHFRISGNLSGVRSIGGAPLKDLTYTVMLDGYDASLISLTRLTDQSSISSGTVATLSGVSDANLMSLSTAISWQLQSPSNILISSGVITCPYDSCRINPLAIAPKGASCEWLMDSQVISSSCNPPTIYPLGGNKTFEIRVRDTVQNITFEENYTLEHLGTPAPKSQQTKPDQSCILDSRLPDVAIIGVNPSPKNRSDEYILLKNTSPSGESSLCGCHIMRTTESKGQVIEKSSADLQAIISSHSSYPLLTSESKLSLPKGSASLELVCQGVVIDTFRYEGNHTNDLLLTQEMIAPSWYQYINKILPAISDTMGIFSAIDLPEVDVDALTTDAIYQESLHLITQTGSVLDPQILWSISSSDADDLSFSGETLVCQTQSHSCGLKGQLIGLVSPGVYHFSLWNDGTQVMMSDWMSPKKDIKLDVLPGIYEIRIQWAHSDDKRRLGAPEKVFSIMVDSDSYVHKKPIRTKRNVSKKHKDRKSKSSQPSGSIATNGMTSISVPAFDPAPLGMQIGCALLLLLGGGVFYSRGKV